MAEIITMPRPGQTAESCILTEWHKNEGDSVKDGDLLFSYETDKASFEGHSSFSGTLLKKLADAGDDVPVLEGVCIIGDPDEDISTFMRAPVSDAAVQSAPAGEIIQPMEFFVESGYNAADIPSASSANDPQIIYISPRARVIANSADLDYSKFKGSGPHGRILERDVLGFTNLGMPPLQEVPQEPATTAAPFANISADIKDISVYLEYEEVPLTNIRKVIAKSMQGSLLDMAQLTHTISFDATGILSYRKTLKESGENLALANISLNDMIIFALSRVIPSHKSLNAHLVAGKMRYFKDVNIGMAVDTERGLLVPTIFGANKLSLNEIANETKRLAKAAQDGKISPDELQGATFTVSNLGAFGIETFTPIINPPQTGLLGVNNIQTKLKMKDGKAVPYQAMGLSLTYDHRALDGAPASRFLQDLCSALENFLALLSK